MLVYSFYVFYRGQKCVYRQDFLQTDSETKLIYGLLATMKSLSQQITEKIQIQDPNRSALSKTTTGSGAAHHQHNKPGLVPLAVQPSATSSRNIQQFNSYTTPKYKLHCLEIPSGYYFVCTTEPNALLDMRDYMRQLYQQFFVPLVLQSPDYTELGGTISEDSRFGREVTQIFHRLNAARSSSSSSVGRS
ncbi:unnamed protein product [Amoebophrya sp. A120]|nr:unnamed protein product [Amoebophrya sp. A120]|eukprot:GSA120T00025597001.1